MVILLLWTPFRLWRLFLGLWSVTGKLITCHDEDFRNVIMNIHHIRAYFRFLQPLPCRQIVLDLIVRDSWVGCSSASQYFPHCHTIRPLATYHLKVITSGTMPAELDFCVMQTYNIWLDGVSAFLQWLYRHPLHREVTIPFQCLIVILLIDVLWQAKVSHFHDVCATDPATEYQSPRSHQTPKIDRWTKSYLHAVPGSQISMYESPLG